MKELALHILDIAENSLRADASIVHISIEEDVRHDLLTITIEDDGCGMDEETLKRALDPFFTTKSERRVGFGLALFRRAAELAAGSMRVSSVAGGGTKVVARFRHSHIDRQPLGDMSSTITTLLLAKPDVDIVYRHQTGEGLFVFDSRLIREELGEMPLSEPPVIKLLAEAIKERTCLDDS